MSVETYVDNSILAFSAASQIRYLANLSFEISILYIL